MTSNLKLPADEMIKGPIKSKTVLPVLVFALILSAPCAAAAAAQTPEPAASPGVPSSPAAATGAPVPATAGAHRDIATTVPRAQAAFDRGLLMLYAFNVGEARAAFRAAEAADPSATLAYFGEAVAETIDINRPTTPDGERRGADAIARGRLAAAGAPDDQRALFDAAASRFAPHRSEQQRFGPYFAALQAYSDAHQSDGMAATLAAYAGWNATGRLTDDADALTPAARTIDADLDRALAADPADVGAHHLRIHFWEQAHRPDHALADADYLAALVYGPGESHLPHMAGHIYDRLGDYPQMVSVNRGACANDDKYFAQGRGDGQEYMRGYHEHDVDFVLYGLTTIGRNADARAFAAHESTYSQEVVALRTRDDRSVIKFLGDAVTPMRVIAEARSGDLDAARKDLAGLSPGAKNEIDYDVAVAAVARAAGDAAGAVAAYRKASAAAGPELGDPKLHWWAPIAEGLGAALLIAHQAAAAEQVFRTELARYPKDPHLEFGLAEALAAQGKDAAAPHEDYSATWEGNKPLTVQDLG